MSDLINLNSILKSSKILRISERSTFKKTLSKISKKKQLDFVLVEKSKPIQMTAVMITKLMGKKFLWLQNFENPPKPGFYTRMLLNQTDTIFVESKKMASKLHNFGIDKPRIKVNSKTLPKLPKVYDHSF